MNHLFTAGPRCIFGWAKTRSDDNRGNDHMGSKTILVVLGASLAATLQGGPQAQSAKAGVEQQLQSLYLPTRIVRDRAAQPGTVLVVRVGGMGALPASNAISHANNYKDGKVRHALSGLLWSSVPGMRDLDPGERVYLLKMDVKDSGITFNVVTCGPCDGFVDPNLAYKASITFQFGKGYLDAPKIDQIRQVIGEVFDPVDAGAPVQTEAMPPPGEGNLALGKPAQLSSLYSSGYEASRCVDGAMDDMCHTDRQVTPWWQVDLQDSYAIGEVVVYNRTDCCGERLRTLNVLISPDGQNWQRIYAHNGSDFQVLRVPGEGRTGRFVRLQLAATDYLNIVEVEVYGTGVAQTQAMPPPEPPPTVKIELGQTKEQVQAMLGQPEKVVSLGTKDIFVYKDLKITFMGGKVSDVQ